MENLRIKGNMMNKQKIGLILFIFAIVWAIFWGVFGSISVTKSLHLTSTEVNETIWALNGPLMMIWGLLGVPLAAILAMTGILLHSGAKGSTVLKYGFGVFLLLFLGITAMTLGHIPILFGIGGTVILLFFMGIMWFWVKERSNSSGSSVTAGNLKLAGYVFLLIAAWFSCGWLSRPFLKAFENESTPSPINIMIFTVLGWLFLFLSHYKSQKKQ